MPFPAPSSAHFEHVVFDLGAVLLNWNPQQIAQEFSPDPTIQELLLKHVFLKDAWQAMDKGLISEQEAIQQFSLSTSLPLHEMQRLMGLVRDLLTVKQDTLALLEDFVRCDYPVYALSNICDEIYTDMTARHACFAHFRDVIVSAREKLIKPEPAIFQLMLERFGIAPESTLFIDDNLQNVEAAKQQGIIAIQFSDADTCRNDIHAIIGV